MNWVLVPQQLITGLLNGGTLGLIALGIVLIFKSSEVFNFAHGHMVMLGAFLTWFFSGGIGDEPETMFNLPFIPAVLAAIAVSMALGFLIERLALRPMTGQPLLSIILMTLGLSKLLEGIVTMFFGVQPHGFPSPIKSTEPFKIIIPPVDGKSIVFLNQIILKKELVATFVVALVVAALFMAFFRYTNLGLSMRATSEDHELARSVGIKVQRVFGMSWAMAGIIATLGGILLGMLSGVSINLATVALVAFPAILLGGLESFGGAILGGLAIGVVQELVKAAKLIEIRNSAEIAPYILLLIVLVLRPEGLFGRKRIERV